MVLQKKKRDCLNDFLLQTAVWLKGAIKMFHEELKTINKTSIPQYSPESMKQPKYQDNIDFERLGAGQPVLDPEPAVEISQHKNRGVLPILRGEN